jgi:hypothetical protein
MQNSLSADFDSNARAISREYALNVDDLKAAYRQKPDSLAGLFNVMSEGKKDKEGALAIAVFLALWVVLIPLVPIPLASYFKGRRKLAEVGKTVRAEIARHTA